MAGEWSEQLLCELLVTTKDGDWGKENPEEGYVPYHIIRGTDFPDVRIGDLSSVPLRYLPEHTVQRRTLEPDDILIETAGGTRDRPTGRTLLVTEKVLARFAGPVTCASFARFLRIDREQADPRFVFWYLQHLYNKGEMSQHQVQHTGVARFQYTRFADTQHVPLPPLAEQKAIAAVLGALDDKIELNRRMNATLDAMVRVLFQSWFVDFDPVRAKLDGRKPDGLDKPTAALFPAAFQDSNLGPIPKGWTVSNIADLATRIAMGPFGSRITRDNFVPDGVPVVRGGNLTDGFVDDDFVFLTEAKADELKASVASSLDLVFTHRGTLGQVGIVPANPRYPRYVVSQSQMLLSVDKGKASPWMVYLFFRSPIGEAALLANTSTTGVPAISRPTTSLKAIPMVLPPTAVGKRYDEVVQPLFLQREQSARHSRTLTTLRDTLLPKLLSGQLSVANLEQIRETIAQ
jgi:type I restriction enzyme S subunit